VKRHSDHDSVVDLGTQWFLGWICVTTGTIAWYWSSSGGLGISLFATSSTWRYICRYYYQFNHRLWHSRPTVSHDLVMSSSLDYRTQTFGLQHECTMMPTPSDIRPALAGTLSNRMTTSGVTATAPALITSKMSYGSSRSRTPLEGSPELGNRASSLAGQHYEDEEPRSSGQPWSQEEDKRLTEAEQAYGPDWVKIGLQFPTRTPGACRGRIKRLKTNHYFSTTTQYVALSCAYYEVLQVLC
jgi:hypothetical protein